MTKNVLSIFVSICLSVCVLTSVSCTDKDFYDPDKDPNYVSENHSTLDFSTTQTTKLELNYEMGTGFVSVFDLYTEYPLDKNGKLRTDLSPIAGGINVVGVSKLKRVIPAYVETLYAYSPSLFVPTISYAKIQNGLASFEAMDIEPSEVGTRAGNAGNFGVKPITKYLKEKNDFYLATENGNYMYDIILPDDYKALPTEVANAMSKTFPESKIADEKYYKDATIKIEKSAEYQEGAEVYLSVLFGGGSYNNSLSYFVYEGSEDLSQLPIETVESLDVINIFQYADVHTNTQPSKKNKKGLTPGKYVQLLYKNKEGEFVKEFPVGAQIGWILHPNSFNEENFTVNNASLTSYDRRLFSVSAWNEPNNTTNDKNIRTNNYTIFFSATDNEGDVYNCFGFEDQPDYNDGDCNDVIFHILTNPVDAINPPPSITDEDIEKTETKKGILLFEDNWPKKGDYDMNDVVVRYNSEITYLQKVKTQDGQIIEESEVMVKKVEDTFSFLYSGANYNNAFSYKVNIPDSAVESIKITDHETGEVKDYTNQITVDGEGFIIDLCENVLDIIEPMNFDVEPRHYTVLIEFKEKSVLQDDFTELSAPYNPFISPRETPGAEVHLPMYPPTSRADMNLFHTEDDRSDKDKVWYVSGENIKFPFALHLADADEDFIIPKEYVDISVTYPKYNDWVENGMQSDKNWYK